MLDFFIKIQKHKYKVFLPNFMQKKETIRLKNMFSRSCMKLIELSCHAKEGVKILKIYLGEVRLEYDDTKILKIQLIKCLEELGFESIKNPEEELVEKTKIAAIELIYKALNSNSLIRNSEYSKYSEFTFEFFTIFFITLFFNQNIIYY